MRRSRGELIESLVEDLRPLRRALAPGALALLWLLASWLLVVGLTLGTGPLRPGVGAQLAEPRFLLECLLGLAAGAGVIRAAARLGTPSPGRALERAAPGLLLLAAWVGAYLYGLSDPALEPSMLGKREGCNVQTLLFGAAPLAFGLWLLRRAAPLERAWTGALAGAAAAALPALMMQAACMYDPAHILSHHLAPIAVLALVGALLGPLALRRI